MKILFVTSECAPFSKSGGLADVANSLPPALKAADQEIAVITPLYQCVREKFADKLVKTEEFDVTLNGETLSCGLYRTDMNGVTVWFTRNDAFFDRPRLYGYDDDKKRFAWFCRAVIEALFRLDFVPEILHCNDWETALAVIYLKNDQVLREELRPIRTVYTIHNIAYQGQFGANELHDTFGLPWGWYDGGLGYVYQGRQDVNLMKGAMMMADAVSTVSPTYARELHHTRYGSGLQGVAHLVSGKMYGILNGIDMALYDPALDKRLPAAFTPGDMSGKAVCKAEVQKRFGLTPEPDWPLLAVVARLTEQKGFDLIAQVLPGLMEMGIQLVVFGQGDPYYTDLFEKAHEKWPDQLGFSDKYNDDTASLVFAGADFYLMPSRFEPCGLSQMMAMRYGTVPIVRETGGLKDSVRPYSSFDGLGDGFSFSEYSSQDLYLAVLHAVRTYLGDPDTFAALRERCMIKDFSWSKSAGQYLQMYAEISEPVSSGELSFEEAFENLKAAYEKIDRMNRDIHADRIRDGFRRLVEIEIVGAGAGYLNVLFTPEEFRVSPGRCEDPDARIACDYRHLMRLAEGRSSIGRLFMKGQLKISGNLAKGFEIKHLLCPN